MKNKVFRESCKLFAAETGTTVAADLTPAIPWTLPAGLPRILWELQQLLGITDLIPMAAGTDIKNYKWTVGELAAQVGEGEDIGSYPRKKENWWTLFTLDLDKYRRIQHTAEAIQKVGRDIAINQRR